MWKSPRARGWSIAVIGSAGLMVFCMFGLWPMLDFLLYFDRPNQSPGDGFEIAAYVVTACIIVFILHVVLLGILAWKSEPDIPYRDAEL